MALDDRNEAGARVRPARRKGKAAQAKKEGAAPRRPNPTPELWAKAQEASRAAQLLAEAGDWNGAANRAYYAVFSGARAALASVRAALAASKGHGTIIRRFERHLIEERSFDRSFGRSLFNRMSHARWVADYAFVGVGEDVARTSVADAERFLAAIVPYLKKVKQ
jgi:uncharacterized protein (UPF0332 family)